MIDRERPWSVCTWTFWDAFEVIIKMDTWIRHTEKDRKEAIGRSVRPVQPKRKVWWKYGEIKEEFLFLTFWVHSFSFKRDWLVQVLWQLVSTDGARAVAGQHSGPITRVKAGPSPVTSVHCSIHREKKHWLQRPFLMIKRLFQMRQPEQSSTSKAIMFNFRFMWWDG